MIVFILLVIFKIYFPWFVITKTLSSGDWPYLFVENIQEFSWWPRESFLWLEPYYQITAKIFVGILGFSWEVTERLVWFWPFLIIGFFSSQYLAKIFFKKRVLQFFSSLVFLSNTYILMIVGGGQMGVAMAYSLAPLVLGRLILCHSCESHVRRGGSRNLYRFRIKSGMTKESIILGSILGLQLMFDPRIAAITLFACFLYLFWSRLFHEKVIGLVFSLLIAVILNLFWILAVIKGGLPQFEFTGEAFTGAGMAEFLSFAIFSNTLSLLHPNWPENIFGKIYFMRSEFLVIPVVAFISLLFTRMDTNRVATKRNLNQKSEKAASRINADNILFFTLLSLIGAFFAKGANPPFAGVYLWLFENLPGFIIFRDPTKFYLLVALSYSVLLPYSVCRLGEALSSKFKVQSSKLQLKVKSLIIFIFVIFWLFTIREAILGKLGGTFKAREVPQEYLKLKNFLVQQGDYFVIFWLPQKQRFGFSSQIHPAIASQQLLPKEELIEQEVKYVIIPFDSEGEIFLEDRKYSEKVREEVMADLKEIEWLKKLENWQKIAVYEIRE